MYVPIANRIDDPGAVVDTVARARVAHLVTVGADGQPAATLMPMLWLDPHDAAASSAASRIAEQPVLGGRLIGHFARTNPHAHDIVDGQPALVIFRGPDAYVTPTWYAEKARTHRVVPTWNYTEVQIRGRLEVFDDIDRLVGVVTRLTDAHEDGRSDPWAVTDAPEKFIRTQLKAVRGVEVCVEAVDAKGKWSQNRAADDIDGVLAGLASDAESATQPRAGEALAEMNRHIR